MTWPPDALEDMNRNMDNRTIEAFIRKQKVAFICSVDEEGFPNVKAMLKPRKTDGLREFLFFHKHFLDESKTVSE